MISDFVVIGVKEHMAQYAEYFGYRKLHFHADLSFLETFPSTLDLVNATHTQQYQIILVAIS